MTGSLPLSFLESFMRASVAVSSRLTASTFEIGAIDRFSDGDRACSRAGLVPSTHASGGTTRHGGITKEGSRWLRWVMVEAAMTHVHKYDTAITKAYHRIAERRGSQAATVAAARKLLMCCYAVLKNRHPYYDQA